MRRRDHSEVFAQRARISRMACCFKHAIRYFKENEIKMIPTAKRIQNEIEDLTSAKMLDTPNTERARNAKKSCRPSRPTSKKCSGYRSRSMKKAV